MITIYRWLKSIEIDPTSRSSTYDNPKNIPLYSSSPEMGLICDSINTWEEWDWFKGDIFVKDPRSPYLKVGSSQRRTSYFDCSVISSMKAVENVI